MKKIIFLTALLFSSVSFGFEIQGESVIDFGSEKSVYKQLVFKNTSDAKASLQTSISGPAARSFLIVLNRCVKVSAGKNCVITIQKTKQSLSAPIGLNAATLLNNSDNSGLASLTFNVLPIAIAPVKLEVYPLLSPVLTMPTSVKSSITSFSIKNEGLQSARPEFTVANALIVLDRCKTMIRPNKSCDVFLSVKNKVTENYKVSLSITNPGSEKTAQIPVHGSLAPELTYQTRLVSEYSVKEVDVLPCQGNVESVRSITSCVREFDQVEVATSFCSDPEASKVILSPYGEFSTALSGGLGQSVSACAVGSKNLLFSRIECLDPSLMHVENGQCVYNDVTPPEITLSFAKTSTNQAAETLSIQSSPDATEMIVSSSVTCSGTKESFSNSKLVSLPNSNAINKFYVKIFDAAGNSSACQVSPDLIRDTTAPAFSSAASLSATSLNSLTATPVLSFAAATDNLTGIKKYQGRVVTANGSNPVGSWTDITSGQSLTQTLSEGLYKIELRAEDGAGNISASLLSPSWNADVTAPDSLVFAFGAANAQTTTTPPISQLVANDNANGSGISSVQIKVLQSDTGTEVVPYTNAILGASHSMSGVKSKNYHAIIKLTDSAGNSREFGSDKTYSFLSIATLVMSSNARIYSDGTYAKTCKEYKNPIVAGNYYAGSTSDGYYWVRNTANGAINKVYCDMTTDNGGWTLITFSRSDCTAATSWNYTTTNGISGAGPVDSDQCYSITPGALGLSFTQILFGDRVGNTKAWGNYVYRHTISYSTFFSGSYYNGAIYLGHPTAIKGGITSGFIMAYYVGFWSSTYINFFRDSPEWSGLGLINTGWSTYYNTNQGGQLNGKQGMIMVRE